MRRDIALRIAQRSPKGTNLTFGSRGSKIVLFDSWPVTESAPEVRPWKPPTAAMISVLPVRREIFIAASFASAPELQKKTRALGSFVRS